MMDREPQEYSKNCNKVTQFFSNSTLQDLFTTMCGYASLMTQDIKYSKKSFKCKLHIMNEESKLGMKILILKVKDEDKYCVEFSKTEGDIFQFNEQFHIAKEYFGGHVNAKQ